MEKKKVALGVGLIAGIGMLAYGISRVVTKPKYPPYVPPVGEPPQEPPPELPPGEDPVLPPDEPEPPPDQPLYEIIFSMLLVNPSIVVLGNTVNISVKATNISTSSKTYELYLGPDTGIRQTVSLASGEQRTYSWTYKPTRLGYYEVWASDIHNMFQVKPAPDEPPTEIPPVNGTVAYTVADWTVYDAADGRGRVYRWGSSWSVVEYWIEADGVHRCQIDGATPFGVWPQHHVFEVGSFYYDPYVAMFSYMDAGYTQGYRSEGWWVDQVNFCQYHPPGTPAWNEMDELNKYYCSFSPYTRQ